MNKMIELPLYYLKPWIDSKEYKKIKYYLLLFFEMKKTQNNAWKLDEVAKIIQHQRNVTEVLTTYWIKEGWLSQCEHQATTYYSLSFIEKTDCLLIPQEIFDLMLTQMRLIDVIRWLAIQMNDISLISEQELSNLFLLERQTGVQRILKGLEKLDLIWFETEHRGETIYYDLDFKQCSTKACFHLNAFHLETKDLKAKEIEIPLILLDYLKTSKESMIAKLYCEWLIYLEEHPNYEFSLNELIQNVFAIKHYNSLNRPLMEMVRLNLVKRSSTKMRRFSLNQDLSSETLPIPLDVLSKVIQDLNHKEFALWLTLHLKPTDYLTTHETLMRLNCKNKDQARNIIKRLSKSGWVKFDSSATKKRKILSTIKGN